MRLQHLKQIASTLSADDPARAAATAVIVEEVERLHWRIWNGKAKDAQISIDCIRAVMHHFRGEPDQRRSTAPSRKLWTALRALDGYLTSQSAWLVNYAEGHRAGLDYGDDAGRILTQQPPGNIADGDQPRVDCLNGFPRGPGHSQRPIQ